MVLEAILQNIQQGLVDQSASLSKESKVLLPRGDLGAIGANQLEIDSLFRKITVIRGISDLVSARFQEIGVEPPGIKWLKESILPPAPVPDTSLITTIIESPAMKFPWQYRDQTSWKTDIRREEAARLFYLISHQYSQQDDLPSLINQWGLEVAFETYWENSLENLTKSIASYRFNDETSFLLKNRDEIVAAASEVFELPLLYPFLSATRQLIRQRNLLSRANGGSLKSFDLRGLRQEKLGFKQSVIEDLESRFQKLVETFYPLAKSVAYRRSRSSWAGLEEWIGNAGVSLTLSVTNFFWETMALNPQWTIARFVRNMTKSIQDTESYNFDAQDMAVPVESAEMFGGSFNPTADEALSTFSEEYINSLINKLATTPQDAEVLRSSIFEGLKMPGIVKRLDLPKNKVAEIIHQFRSDLYSLSEDGESELNLPPQREYGVGHAPFWENLFSNLEKYRQYFEKRWPMLRPFQELVLQKFFELQTGDRDSTVQAVWQWFKDQKWDLQPDSIRRAISAGINQIDYKERSQSTLGQLNKGWSRSQQAKLIAEISQNPNVWETFPQQTQYILQRFFIEGGGRSVVMKQIAQEIGIHESTVSRILDRSLRTIYKIQFNPQSAFRPRKLYHD